MSQPNITFDDIYLILRPISIDIWTIGVPVIFLGILIYLYKDYKKQVSGLNYALITLLIVVNSTFIPVFVGRIFKEIGRFINLDYRDCISEIVSKDFDKLYTYMDKKVKPDERFFFNDPTDVYHDNVRTQFRLAYYLVPRRKARNFNEADYIVIINYENKPDLRFPIPRDKKLKFHRISDQVLIIDLTEKKTKQD